MLSSAYTSELNVYVLKTRKCVPAQCTLIDVNIHNYGPDVSLTICRSFERSKAYEKENAKSERKLAPRN